jgi:hypothetical protein
MRIANRTAASRKGLTSFLLLEVWKWAEGLLCDVLNCKPSRCFDSSRPQHVRNFSSKGDGSTYGRVL